MLLRVLIAVPTLLLFVLFSGVKSNFGFFSETFGTIRLTYVEIPIKNDDKIRYAIVFIPMWLKIIAKINIFA